MENSRSIEPTFLPIASLAAVHGTAKKMRLQMANETSLTHRQTTLLLPLSKHEREQVRRFFSRRFLSQSLPVSQANQGDECI